MASEGGGNATGERSDSGQQRNHVSIVYINYMQTALQFQRECKLETNILFNIPSTYNGGGLA